MALLLHGPRLMSTARECFRVLRDAGANTIVGYDSAGYRLMIVVATLSCELDYPIKALMICKEQRSYARRKTVIGTISIGDRAYIITESVKGTVNRKTLARAEKILTSLGVRTDGFFNLSI